MKRIWLIFQWLILVFVTTNAQIVSTQFGKVQGVKDGNIYVFKGIPFAKPPVDSLRWKEPQTPDLWTDTLLAANFAPVCPQKQFVQGSTDYTIMGDEDCLYLNVWTPAPDAAKRAVMVFIHGGGNQQGGASETGGGTQMYAGKNLSERGDVVVVTIQYRLGPLGFLVHPGLNAENTSGKSGNYAVLDQILALKWVQNNISAFGGDPANVMIFGESAGGVNVGNLLLTTKAAGLFQRACIESALPVLDEFANSQSAGVSYVNAYTNTGTDVDKIAYMRTLPADSLVKDEVAPLSGGMVSQSWKSVVDGIVFTAQPNATFQSGAYNKVPLMIGSNSEETSLSSPSTVTPTQVSVLINSYFLPTNRTEAQTYYPPGSTNDEARVSYVAMTSDAQFTLGTRHTAQCVSVNQTEPVWRYFFTHKHTVSALQALGSYHGMELFYVFNNWENATLGKGLLFKPQDDSVQYNMMKYWTNFAKTGNPNDANLVAWPQYNAVTDCYLEIKATPNGSQTGIRKAQCDLWDKNLFYTPCSSSLSVLENNFTEQLLISPNPTTNVVRVKGLDATTDYSLSLFDLNGNELMQTKSPELNLSGLTNGIYLLKLNKAGKLSVAKIIKQ